MGLGKRPSRDDVRISIFKSAADSLFYADVYVRDWYCGRGIGLVNDSECLELARARATIELERLQRRYDIQHEADAYGTKEFGL